MSCLSTFRQVFAFYRRDLVNATSYKLNIFFQAMGMFVWAFVLGMLGKIAAPAMTSMMRNYGGMDYSTFLMVGMIFNNFLNESLMHPRAIVNPGSLERILMSPVNIPVFVMGTLSYPMFMLLLLNLAIFPTVGVLFFSMKISAVNWPTLAFVLLLGIISMWGFGIISAAVQLVTKRWEPVSWFFQVFSAAISGMWYDPSVLLTIDPSGFLQKLAWCLPQTYVFYMQRQAFIGRGLTSLLFPYVLNLFLIIIIVFPVSMKLFLAALRECKVQGSLGWE